MPARLLAGAPVLVLVAVLIVLGTGAPATAQVLPPPTPTPAPAPPPLPDPDPVPELPGTSPLITMQPGPAAECGWSNVPACVSEAMAGFFKDLVVPGLNEALGLLGETVLATPKLDEIPIMGHLWEHSRQIVLISYGLVVTICGVVVLAYQTLQTRASLREVLPRIAVGFIAANLSLLLAGWAIDLANSFSLTILGDSIDPEQVGEFLGSVFMRDIDVGSMLVLLIALVLVVMVVVVLLTYVVRVMLTVVLIAAAPLLLMCHALPQTESIAFWWWKAFAGTLVIQIGQSFALVAAIKVFLSSGGVNLF